MKQKVRTFLAARAQNDTFLFSGARYCSALCWAQIKIKSRSLAPIYLKLGGCCCEIYIFCAPAERVALRKSQNKETEAKVESR
jgi:hypothetical protein